MARAMPPRPDHPLQARGLSLDLNCDLGEGEPAAKTAALMAHIASANIACGGHAGDHDSIRHCLQLARQFHVRPGAHPGLPDPATFGRAPQSLSPEALRGLLRTQVGTFLGLCDEIGIQPTHIKLHGALYHMTERDSALREAYLDGVAQEFPSLTLYALARGRVAASAQARGLAVWREAFLDRAYLPDGTLVPRDQPGAVIHDPGIVKARIQSLRERGEIATTGGGSIRLEVETLCLHGDSPGAPALAEAARAWLA